MKRIVMWIFLCCISIPACTAKPDLEVKLKKQLVAAWQHREGNIAEGRRRNEERLKEMAESVKKIPNVEAKEIETKDGVKVVQLPITEVGIWIREPRVDEEVHIVTTSDGETIETPAYIHGYKDSSILLITMKGKFRRVKPASIETITRLLDWKEKDE